MRCRAARKLLSLRLDGRLDRRAATGLDGHLRACPACTMAAARLEGAWKRLDAIGEVGRAPDDFAAIAESAAFRSSGRRRSFEPLLAWAPRVARPFAALAVAASVVAGVTSGLTLGRAAFARPRGSASPEALVLSEGFGVIPFGSPAAGLARALGSRTEGRE